ncbi:MAG: PspA/IM30 family protein [Verrucomicrobiota bacterium]
MFKRLFNLVKGFFGRMVGGLEKANPEALLEVEKENLRKTISKFNKSLATHAALCERLVTRVRALEKEETELRAKTAAALKVGNKKLAGQMALRLQNIKTELEEYTSQAEDAEKTYKELTQARDVSIKEARAKIEEISRGINEMKVSKAMADLNEMASGMVSEIGGSGDTLNRLQEMIEDERSKAKGRARVAKDSIDTTGIEQMAAEQDALEELALADFAAAEGLTLEGGATESSGDLSGDEESTKTMGGSESESA